MPPAKAGRTGKPENRSGLRGGLAGEMLARGGAHGGGRARGKPLPLSARKSQARVAQLATQAWEGEREFMDHPPSHRRGRLLGSAQARVAQRATQAWEGERAYCPPAVSSAGSTSKSPRRGLLREQPKPGRERELVRRPPDHVPCRRAFCLLVSLGHRLPESSQPSPEFIMRFTSASELAARRSFFRAFPQAHSG